jgi:hypothetical protein
MARAGHRNLLRGFRLIHTLHRNRGAAELPGGGLIFAQLKQGDSALRMTRSGFVSTPLMRLMFRWRCSGVRTSTTLPPALPSFFGLPPILVDAFDGFLHLLSRSRVLIGLAINKVQVEKETSNAPEIPFV